MNNILGFKNHSFTYCWLISWRLKITLILPDLSQEMWTGSPRLKRPAASCSANLKMEKTDVEQSETCDTGAYAAREGAEEETPLSFDPCIDPDGLTSKTAVSKSSSRHEGGKPSSSKKRKTHEKEFKEGGSTGDAPPSVGRRFRGKTSVASGGEPASPAQATLHKDKAKTKVKPTVKAMPKLIAVKRSHSALQLDANKPKKGTRTAAKSVAKPAAKSFAKQSQPAVPSRPSQTDDGTFDLMAETRLTSWSDCWGVVLTKTAKSQGKLL